MLAFPFRLVRAALVVSPLLVSAIPASHGQDLKRTASPPKQTSDIARMLRKMHAHLKSNDLEFRSQFSTIDKVLSERRNGTANFSVRQPNLFRVSINADGRTELFVSDGKALWVYRNTNRRYVKFDARDSVLGTMYAATGLMFMPSRVLDAFWTVDYLERLNEDVRTSPLADAKVSGRSCRGVRVVRFEDQFDFWLEPVAPHLPCKLVSRRSDGSSQSVTTHVFTWSTPNLAPDTWRFAPPKGARRVDNF